MKELNILRINSVPQFAIDYYASNSKFLNLTYDELLDDVLENNFAHPGSWSKTFKHFGYISNDIIINFDLLQKKWNLKRDKVFRNSLEILFDQINFYKPNIIFIYAGALLTDFPKELRQEIKNRFSFVKIMTGLWGDHLIGNNYKKIFNDLDLIFTNCIPLEHEFKKNGVNSIHLGNCFEKNVKGVDDIFLKKEFSITHNVMFSGVTGYGSYDHQERYYFLLKLLKNIDMTIYTEEKKIKRTPKDILRINLIKLISMISREKSESLLKKKFHFKIKKIIRESLMYKEDQSFLNIYKLKQIPLSMLFKDNCHKLPIKLIDYYKNVKSSIICLNLHRNDPFDVGNIRSFEVPGLGSFLLSDKSTELNVYLTEGKHFIGYKNFEDCKDKINYFLKHTNERKEIALEGQRHCLKFHTFENRFEKLMDVFKYI